MWQKMWNEELETMAPLSQTALERDKLASQLQYVFANSPFVRRKFDEAGLKPEDISRTEDLSRLPFTTKEELRQSQKEAPPFGDYLAAPRVALSVVHRTSGSTGKFLFTAMTRADMLQTNECGARAFWAAGLRPDHTVVHCLNYSLWMGGYTDHRNLENTGAAVVPFGVGNSRQLVSVIREAGIDAISCTPSYPRHLENVVRDELGVEPAELGLKLGLFGGEPGLENSDFRSGLERTWGMRAANANYGMSEVLCNFASVCEEENDLHFLGQGVVLAQVIDPVTAEDIALDEGRRGELVLTHLERQAQPLVRYRTGDIIECRGIGPCRCGRTGFRFAVVGRSDDMLHVRGINVFPTAIAQVLQTMAPQITGEFQVVVTGPGPYDYLELDVERSEGDSSGQIESLEDILQRKLKDALSFTARVTLVPARSITSTEMGKTARVVRRP